MIILANASSRYHYFTNSIDLKMTLILANASMLMYQLANLALLARVTVCHHTEGNVTLA